MGPISLFALIILLSLAVLAVLATTTAQATFASAEKQAGFTADTYVNEAAAQEFLADVDEKLASARETNVTSEEALEEIESSLPSGAWVEDGTIRAEFYQESGRTLTITLTITDDVRYRVTQWQATTKWTTSEEGETLWQGGAE